MPNRLQHKTALVTGSTSGIGLAIALAFADEGAHVLISGRRTSLGDEVARKISSAGGRATFVGGDITADTRHFAARALEAGGGQVDILVNNAAKLMDLVFTPDLSEEALDLAYKTNLRAPFVLTGVLAPPMAARGQGVVLNIGSVNGRTGLSGTAAYSATKAAIESLTRSWAAEFGRYGVRVNAILPGATENDRTLDKREHFAPMLARTASGRMSLPTEVAAAATFLASDEASHIHGVSLPVDGGYLAVSRPRLN